MRQWRAIRLIIMVRWKIASFECPIQFASSNAHSVSYVFLSSSVSQACSCGRVFRIWFWRGSSISLSSNWTFLHPRPISNWGFTFWRASDIAGWCAKSASSIARVSSSKGGKYPHLRPNATSGSNSFIVEEISLSGLSWPRLEPLREAALTGWSWVLRLSLSMLLRVNASAWSCDCSTPLFVSILRFLRRIDSGSSISASSMANPDRSPDLVLRRGSWDEAGDRLNYDIVGVLADVHR